MINAAPPKKINLVPLISLETEIQLKIRELRNEINIRKWMYTDHLIGVNEHLSWINKLKQDNSQIVFAILDETLNTPLGLISVNEINTLHKKADWAYYLGETARGGLGTTLEYHFINFIFEILKLEKLNCEVIEGNAPVIALHKKFHFEEEGFRRSNIIKNNDRVGVHLLGLTKEDWIANKQQIFETHKELFKKFSITIHWHPNNESDSLNPIDQIENTRAKNNLNWMSILRLALEKSPQAATEIVTEIKRLDHEISSLTDKLIQKELISALNPKNKKE